MRAATIGAGNEVRLDFELIQQLRPFFFIVKGKGLLVNPFAKIVLFLNLFVLF